MKLRDWWYNFHNVSGGSEDTLFGIKIFGTKHYDKKWFKNTILPTYYFFRSIHRANLWLGYRLHPQRRYHVIKTGLEPGYYDEDTLILHGCMAILCRYVKWYGEPELEQFNKDLRDPMKQDKNGPSVEGQADSQEGALAIYRWWKYERPKDEKRRDELLDELYGKKSRIKFVPSHVPNLSKIEFDQFEGDEVDKEREFRALEAKIFNDEQVMLHRLIDLRPSLWT